MSDDSDVEMATLADTPEQLEHLFRNKHRYWEWAAFVSVLVQDRRELQTLVDQHQASFAPHSTRRVISLYALKELYLEVLRRLMSLAEKLERTMTSAPFRRLFADSALYKDEPTRESVINAAKALTDYYRANLLLAREARGVVALDEYGEVIENIAHLIDKPLAGVDNFITRMVGLIEVLPTLEQNSSGQDQFHSFALDIEWDETLTGRIQRQLDNLERPRKRWSWRR